MHARALTVVFLALLGHGAAAMAQGQAASADDWQRTAAEIDAMSEPRTPAKEFTQEEMAHWNAVNKKWEEMQRAAWRPTCIAGKLDGRTRGQRQRQEIEGRVLAGRLEAMAEAFKKGTSGRDAYERELLELRAATRRHPGEAQILLALGDLHEAAPAEAIPWYALATQVADDGWWNYPVQQAWQKLARMHEADGNIPAAIRALQAWQVHEECGNGCASSECKKQFWIWRLETQVEPRLRILDKAWRELQEDKLPVMFVSGSQLRGWMGALYAKDGEKTLDGDIREGLKYMEEYRLTKEGRTQEEKRHDDAWVRLLKSMQADAKE